MERRRRDISSALMDLILFLLQREYEEEYVRAMIIEDVGKIFLPEGVVELVRGSEYSLPRWVARELASRGLVETRDDGIGLERLAKIAYTEETTSKKTSFESIPPYFYHIVRDEVKGLYNVLEKERKPSILSDISKYEECLSKIGRIRVRKIINLLLITPPQEILKKLSEEEAYLYTILRSILSEWLISLRIEKGS